MKERSISPVPPWHNNLLLAGSIPSPLRRRPVYLLYNYGTQIRSLSIRSSLPPIRFDAVPSDASSRAPPLLEALEISENHPLLPRSVGLSPLLIAKSLENPV